MTIFNRRKHTILKIYDCLVLYETYELCATRKSIDNSKTLIINIILIMINIREQTF